MSADLDKLRAGAPLDIPANLYGIEVPDEMTHCVWHRPKVAVLTVEQAAALRDWLNTVLTEPTP